MLYDWTNPKDTLEEIKGKILASMKTEENWYVNYRKWHYTLSKAIRVFAVCLFSVGILLPLLHLENTKIKGNDINIGYVGLAVGALFLLLDKYLGVSSGFVRFYIAEIEIKKSTSEFESNWDIEIAKASDPMTVESIVTLLNILKQFKQAIFTTIQAETTAWATEFQTQTGELYELFKQRQNEAAKPIHILVSLENYSTYQDIELGIDNEIPVKLNRDTSIIFKNVTLEPHLIKVQATNSQMQIVAFSKNVDTAGGKNVEITLTLP